MKPQAIASAVSAVFFLLPGPDAHSKEYILASGRWDNTAIVIDVEKALLPANDGTPNAVVSRLRVTPDLDTDGDGRTDTIASGQPIVVGIAPDGKRAYVVNHSGRSSPKDALAFQHGLPGTVTVLDLKKALDPASHGTLNAVETIMDSGGFGATGFAIAPSGKHAALAHAEMEGKEDGGRHISIVDLETHQVIHRVEQAYGKPGFPCPCDPVPKSAPDPRFGCFPDTNGVTISPLGGGYIFTANGGTNDVSVISLAKALARDPAAETGRIPMQAGGFGITTSPDGRLVAHASRENAQTGKAGNTVSLISVEKAITDPAHSEVARLLLGTSDPDTPTRPFVAAFTADGKRLVVTHFLTNNVSIVDVEKALAGQPAETARITLETPDGRPSRPRGLAFTPDARHAVISGAPKGGPDSGVVWLLDLRTLTVTGRVTGIGNESYMIAAFSGG